MRARFELDGQPRVGEWSHSIYPWYVGHSGPARSLGGRISDLNYFRFVTPGAPPGT